MHINLFDHYQKQHSLIHQLDPRVKIVVTVFFILTMVMLPDGSWLGYLLGCALVLIGHILARISLIFSLKRSLIVLPFALTAMTMIFTIPGQALVSGAFGPYPFVITGSGVIRFLSVMIRSLFSVQAAILLTASTPFPDLLHGLRHLRVPTILVSIIAFMYRYLYILVDEAVRLLRAREARSAVPKNSTGGRSVLWRAQVAGNMAGQLFLRSFERSERVYNAMLARGYRGHFLTLNPHQMQTADWIFGASSLLILSALLWVGRLNLL